MTIQMKELETVVYWASQSEQIQRRSHHPNSVLKLLVDKQPRARVILTNVIPTPAGSDKGSKEGKRILDSSACSEPLN
jgi:hypothetical protein